MISRTQTSVALNTRLTARATGQVKQLLCTPSSMSLWVTRMRMWLPSFHDFESTQVICSCLTLRLKFHGREFETGTFWPTSESLLAIPSYFSKLLRHRDLNENGLLIWQD